MVSMRSTRQGPCVPATAQEALQRFLSEGKMVDPPT